MPTSSKKRLPPIKWNEVKTLADREAIPRPRLLQGPNDQPDIMIKGVFTRQLAYGKTESIPFLIKRAFHQNNSWYARGYNKSNFRSAVKIVGEADITHWAPMR